MFKITLSKKEARAKLKAGIDAGADIARVTLGPCGKNVLVDRGIITPNVTNDGYQAIQSLILKDRAENMGLDVLKSIVLKTSDTARGARTACVVLTQAIFEAGLEYIDDETRTEKINVTSLKKNIIKVTDRVIEELKKSATPVNTISDIEHIATISSESPEIGKIIAQALNEIGKDGVITSEEVPIRAGLAYESAQGMKINQGWIDSYMVNDYAKMEASYSDVAVILVDKKLMMANEIQDLIGQLGEKGIGEILLIAEDIQGEVLQMCILNKLKGGFKIVGVKAPGAFGSNKKEILKDIAILTGATILGENLDLKTTTISNVGFSSKIIVGETTSTILGNPERKKEVEERIASLKEQKKNLKSKTDIDHMQERISKLSGGAAIVKIGTATTLNANFSKNKIDDAIAEAKAAYEEGIIAGGGSALAIVASRLTKEDTMSLEEKIAIDIVSSALLAPLKQIAINAGIGDGSEILQKVLARSIKNPNAGYDANNDIVVDDMIKVGIVDSFKVVKISLENAAEGAATLLTTEKIIADDLLDNKSK